MGALINAAGMAVRWMPDAKGDHRPNKVAAGILGQAENESIRRV